MQPAVWVRSFATLASSLLRMTWGVAGCRVEWSADERGGRRRGEWQAVEWSGRLTSGVVAGVGSGRLSGGVGG